MARPYGRVHFLRTAAGLAVAAFRDGRLPLSPRRWLVDLRHLRREMAAGASDATPGTGESREAFARRRLRELKSFLSAGERVRLPSAEQPTVSVLLVLFNRAELTLGCLRALSVPVPVPTEVVIVDNASTDRTGELLDRVDGARVERWPENAGFLRAANAAARRARGDILLFLNNDAELLSGALEAVVSGVRSSPDVGAVCGRLILPDGSLQEAGSIVWSDGSCTGHGRGRRPDAGEFLFERDVDFGSGALLATPRDLFLDLGGFDEQFVPAYYEDVDYCTRLWQSGRRVVYRPDVAARHYEFASSASPAAAAAMQRERQARFVARHRTRLTEQPVREAGELVARSHPPRQGRVLFLDDRPPDRTAGFGFPRSAEIVQVLTDLGHFVTVYALSAAAAPAGPARRDVPPTVEVLTTPGSRGVAGFFRERRGYYDRIMVSRSHNMELLTARLGPPSTWSPGARVIYDAEAVAVLRDVGRRRLAGEPVDEREVDRLVRAEARLAAGADVVLAVSDLERLRLIGAGCGRVDVVGHAVDVAPTPLPFESRQGMLFVGGFHESSPNADAVLWFAREVLPRVHSRLGRPVPLTVVGSDPPEPVRALATAGVRVPGGLPQLQSEYGSARVFIAPTRFAAGIPLKVIHAAAAGVPVVATSLLARQLGWADPELVVADDAGAFASACVELLSDPGRWLAVRSAGLARVRTDFSPGRLRDQLARALA